LISYPCRVVIVDDNALVRNGLRLLIEALGAKVIGEAENGRSGIQQAESLCPEVILLDVSMPIMGGIAAARELCKLKPSLGIILISQYSDRAYAEEALQIGAGAYVLKTAASTELGPAVDAVMSGRTFVSAGVGVCRPDTEANY
jgi:two-component system, NarL family, nitrate/nitrite response regulator NarL